MVDRTFNWRRKAITAAWNKTRDLIMTKSPEQLAREAEDEKTNDSIAALLRADTEHLRPARKPT